MPLRLVFGVRGNNSVLLNSGLLLFGRRSLDASLHDLASIGKDGMLEPFVLLSAADRAYRDQHREQLHAYIDKYLVHPAVK
jgi:hypothetical protein